MAIYITVRRGNVFFEKDSDDGVVRITLKEYVKLHKEITGEIPKTKMLLKSLSLSNKVRREITEAVNEYESKLKEGIKILESEPNKDDPIIKKTASLPKNKRK